VLHSATRVTPKRMLSMAISYSDPSLTRSASMQMDE